MANLKRRVTERDGAVWNDDCVEMFLDPTGGRGEYLHFIANVSGAQYDERGADSSRDRFRIARTCVSQGVDVEPENWYHVAYTHRAEPNGPRPYGETGKTHVDRFFLVAAE